MTALRARLPNRRASTTFGFACGAHRYVATVSYFPTGELAEIFVNNGRAGSHIDAAANESAVLASLLLQHSVPLDLIRNALLRDSHGTPLSPLGAALDVIAGEDGATP